MRGPVHVIDSSSDAPALEHYIFKKTNSKGPYLRMCKTALEAIRGSAAASSGWGFNLDDWIAVLRAPKEKKLQSQSLDRLIRIATVSYTPAPGDVQPGTTVGGAAAGGGARAGTEPAPSEDVLAIGVAGMNQYTLVDNPVRLRLALEALEGAVSVAVDLEGVNLGGSQEDGGYITTIQLCKEARGLVYIIDLLSLGDEAAFTGPYSMRDFLQDPAVEKLFWDCRTDLRALRSNHGVEVRNIVDLQLVQVACLSASGADVVRVQGLGRAIDKSLKHQLTHEERTRIEDTKELSHRLFAPNLGGSFDILAVRPLLPVLIEYCTDVRYFHMLKITFAVPRGMFTCGVEVEFPHELSAAIAKRVESSASMMYRPDDRDANTLADPELVAAVAKKRDEAKTAGLGARKTKIDGKAKSSSSSSSGGSGCSGGGGGVPATVAAASAKNGSKTEMAKREEMKSVLAKHVVQQLKPYFKKEGIIQDIQSFKKVAREITKTVMDGIDKRRAGSNSAASNAAGGGGSGGGGGSSNSRRAGQLPRWSCSSRTPSELKNAAVAAVRIKMCDKDPLGII